MMPKAFLALSLDNLLTLHNKKINAFYKYKKKYLNIFTTGLYIYKSTIISWNRL